MGIFYITLHIVLLCGKMEQLVFVTILRKDYKMRTKGILYTILSAVLFGITPVLASLSYTLGSNSLTLTFYRNFMVLPVLLVCLIARKTDFRVTKKQLAAILGIGILGRGITTLMLYSAYQYIGIGISTTLHFLYPIFVAVICRIFFRDTLGRARMMALLCAVSGVALFMEPSSGALSLTGVFLAVGSGLSYAVYMVGMDKFGLKEIDPLKLSFYMAAAVSFGMLLYNLPRQQIVFFLPPRAAFYTFVVAICTSFFAVALLQLGIKYLNATSAALFSLFEPICGSIAGAIFLNEQMSMAKVFGSFMILCAVVILTLADRKTA